jgi:quercetin dioxygenase-like cupin family protein
MSESGEPARALRGVRIVHSERPVVPSPSGLPTQHLVCAETGSSSIFVGQQWLQPGDRVYRHSHPCEESVTFLSGSGEASMGDEAVPISAGTSLFFPTGLLHGFRNTGTDVMHVIVVFPVPYFAPTDIVEEPSPGPTGHATQRVPGP